MYSMLVWCSWLWKLFRRPLHYCSIYFVNKPGECNFDTSGIQNRPLVLGKIGRRLGNNPVISNGWPGTPLSPTHEIFIQTLDFTLQLLDSQRVQRRVLDTGFCMFLRLIQILLNHVHFHQTRLGWLFEVPYRLLYLKFHPRETYVFFWKWFRLWTNGKLRQACSGFLVYPGFFQLTPGRLKFFWSPSDLSSNLSFHHVFPGTMYPTKPYQKPL